MLLLVLLVLSTVGVLQLALAQDAQVNYPAYSVVASADGITLPEGLTAGYTTLNFQNDTEIPFSPIFARFKEGKTMPDFMTAMQAGGPGPVVEVVDVLGSPTVNPGETLSATYDLTAGEYIVLSFSADGPPNILPLVVGEAAADAITTEPEADVNLVMVDFAFALPGEIAAGEQTWKLDNIGDQVHQIEIYSVPEDATLAGMITEFTEVIQNMEPNSGRPDFGHELVYSWAAIGPDVAAWATLDLPPGQYFIACFVPESDAAEMVTHFAHGMVRLVTVR
ncbi:MAG: hypothetical protein SF029_17000 [bacterium]|nr:hypothetical protein [bacterium]